MSWSARRGTRWVRRVAVLVAVLAGAAVVVPAASVHPTSISLTTIGTAKAVDAGDGIVWVLALGSEAASGDDVTTGLTDAIQLIGVQLDTGRAVAIGLPRDLYVEMSDGRARLNTALRDEGPEGVAREVDDLLGIEPDVVAVTGFDGFLSMMGAVGDVQVDSPLAFTTEEGDVQVRRGPNTFDPDEALYYARTRETLPGGSDFERAANHQRLLLGVLERLREAEDEAGFMEAVTLSALGGLQTDMSPPQVYRLVQALTTVDPGRTDACIIVGTFGVENGASVVYPDVEQARAVGARRPGRRAAPGRLPRRVRLTGRAQPRPASRALTIACARCATCSLAKMLLAWLRTVLTDRPELARDLGVLHALGDQAEHDALALGQLGEGVGDGPVAHAPEVGHHPLGDAGPEDHLAGTHGLDRPAGSRRGGRP